MRDDIEFIAKATMPNWQKFKEYFRGLPPGHRTREIQYQQRLNDQYTTEFRNLMFGRAGELDSIHGELKAGGK
jgi:hypothetical protein